MCIIFNIMLTRKDASQQTPEIITDTLRVLCINDTF